YTLPSHNEVILLSQPGKVTHVNFPNMPQSEMRAFATVCLCMSIYVYACFPDMNYSIEHGVREGRYSEGYSARREFSRYGQTRSDHLAHE
ncbi:hypothetical protein PV327_011328, partial [Microctonus hyperodae]